VIHETNSKKSQPAVTSDRWHVVHARWSGERSPRPRFERSIVSEHGDRTAATNAARALVTELTTEMYGRPHEHRDQIFVRQPAYRTLKTAGRVDKRNR
jgi:hypothetical protein